MSKFAKHIPSNPYGKQKINAQGPQDCVPMNPEQFAACTTYVAKSFMSAAIVPKDFFHGVPVNANLSKDELQRTLLTAYAFFKKNQVLALSYFFRYNALLKLHASTDLSKWVTQDEGNEYAVFNADIIAIAARRPMLSSGQFDAAAFLVDLEELSAVSHAQSSKEIVPQPLIQPASQSTPMKVDFVSQEHMAA